MSFFNKLNFFGLSPQLYIQGQEKYHSKIGFLLSFLLILTLIASCWVYGNDIYYRKEPKTTFSEQINSNQKRYDLTQDQFNFGFSLQNSNWEHYIDESIYTVKFKHNVTIKKIKDNGDVYYDFQSNDIKARKCTIEDFPIDTQYFKNLGFIEYLYCADKKDAYGSDAFSTILIETLPCKQYLDDEQTILNPIQCKSQEIIDQQLAQNNWAIYFTDQILDPNRHEDPFKFTGRDTYGLCSNQMFRQIDLYFRNVYLEDNVGIIFNDIQEKRGLSFEREKEFSQNTPYQSGQFLRLQLRYEKAKETKIYRTYLNLAQVLANIGGILKVFFVVFTVISYVISQRLYYLTLTNELFRFESTNVEKINDDDLENQNLLLHDLKSDQQKIQEAFEAFKEIGKKKTKKQIDSKILQLMDREVYKKFEQQLGFNIDIESNTKNSPDFDKHIFNKNKLSNFDIENSIFQNSNSGFQQKKTKKSNFQENVENSKNFEKSQITQIIQDQDQNILQEQQQSEKIQNQDQEDQDHVSQLLSYKDIEQNLPHESDRPQFQTKYKQSFGQMNPNIQEQQKENQLFSQPNSPTQKLQNSNIIKDNI